MTFSRMAYIIPRCSPDRASIWDAPLALKADVTSASSPDLSPVVRAVTRAAVSRPRNGMLEIIVFNISAVCGAASVVPSPERALAAEQKMPALMNSADIEAMVLRRKNNVMVSIVNAAMDDADARNTRQSVVPAALKSSSPAAMPAVNVNAGIRMSYALVITMVSFCVSFAKVVISF